MRALSQFAVRHRALACLGYTHYQPAQLTTMGKRACLWLHDALLDLEEIDQRLGTLKFRGAKGTTGTQASFLTLFRGDHAKVRQLDQLVAQKMGFAAVYPVTGQTYSRKVDSQILDCLSGLGQTCHKLGSDIRLLAHDQELDEPFEKDQVGSSAMAYKRNPMRSERMCGLARFVTSLASSAAQTAANQWLERTLDDSVNRRLILPQGFLAADGMLRLALNVCQGMQPNPDVIARRVAQFYPYMVTENLMMAAVARGADRQLVHKVVRDLSQEVTEEIKRGRLDNDLLERLRKEPLFEVVDFAAVLDRTSLIGRSAEQVDEFVGEVIQPILDRSPSQAAQPEQLTV
jgi:adenylosuccinate lyase